MSARYDAGRVSDTAQFVRCGEAGSAPIRSARPTLLYVSAVVPLLQGRGCAMRSAANLEALCKIFSVTLALVNPDEAELEALPATVRTACAEIVIVRQESLLDRASRKLTHWRAALLVQMIWPRPPALARAEGAIRLLAHKLDLSRFNLIHCFRLHLAQVASLVPRHQPTPRLMLDLDDYESHARLRGVSRRGPFVGLATLLEGVKYWITEARYIPRFEKAYVCSAKDKRALARRFPTVAWEVVPNIVAPPAPAPRRAQNEFTFLFVGSLDYSPNKEGVLFFCREVLPILRGLAKRPFKLMIVGRNPDETVLSLETLDGVEVRANPPDVAPFYAESDVCIAPIRAGGGTRIKILEAFSHRLPVVSTTIGAEGLDVSPSVHAEIADSAHAFANACARLMDDRDLRVGLARRGHELYQQRFSPAMLEQLFRGIHAGAAARGAAPSPAPVPA